VISCRAQIPAGKFRRAVHLFERAGTAVAVNFDHVPITVGVPRGLPCHLLEILDRVRIGASLLLKPPCGMHMLGIDTDELRGFHGWDAELGQRRYHGHRTRSLQRAFVCDLFVLVSQLAHGTASVHVRGAARFGDALCAQQQYWVHCQRIVSRLVVGDVSVSLCTRPAWRVRARRCA
jgi:hypothetical protein